MIRQFMKFSEALEIASKSIVIKLEEQEVDSRQALGRIVSRDIYAPIDLPPYDRSAVDGYAVRAEDTYGASPSNPIPLRIVGEMSFTSTGDYTLRPREAVKVYTGTPLPKGANAVVMLEDCQERDGFVYVMRSVGLWTNVSRKGEDIERGAKVISRGDILKPWHIAALLALGITKVWVYRALKVCIYAIGSELVEPQEGTRVYFEGKVLNSSAWLIALALKRLGFIDVRYQGIIPDDIKAIAASLDKGVRECDVVITTGGTGVGKYDLVVQAVESIGGKVLVRGIAMRPGRPTSMAILDGKPIFMLSGFPVASYIGLEMFVLPVLARALNIKGIEKPIVLARLTRRVANVVGYTSFVRVKLFKCDYGICAEPIAMSGSGVISTLLHSNGILEIPSDVEGYEAGDYVLVYLLGV